MGSFSIMHMAILLVIVLLVFGAGRLPNVMGDFAKGIKAFKAGMREDDKPLADAGPQPTILSPSTDAAQAQTAQPMAAERKIG